MSENFDDLLHPHLFSLNSNSVQPSNSTTNTFSSSSSSSSSPPSKPITYAFDDPLKNPFADLPSSTSNDTVLASHAFLFPTNQPHIDSTFPTPNASDSLSSNFENLSLSSPNLASPSTCSSVLPLTTSSTHPSTSPLVPPSSLKSLDPTLGLTTKLSSPLLSSSLDHSSIIFTTVKPPPSFLINETVVLTQGEEIPFHDPLLNPPSTTSTSSSKEENQVAPDSPPLPSLMHRNPSITSPPSSHPTTLNDPPPASSDPLKPTSFFISVTDPIKISDPLSPYVVYKVTSKRMTEFPPQEYTVSRRYTEFLWLYNQLLLAYPGFIIPSLPHKQAVGRFQDDFIEHRRIGLNQFLVKLANHPTLCNDSQFLMFLRAETISHKGLEKPLPLSTKIKVHDPDKYFETKFHETEMLENLYKALFKSLDIVMTRHSELSKVHSEVGELLYMFAEVEEPHPLFQLLQQLGDVHYQLKNLNLGLVSTELMNFSLAMEEQIRMLSSIKTAFQTRFLKLRTLQNLESIMQKRRASLSQTSISQPHIVSELENLTSALQSVHKEFEEISKTLRQELQRVHHERYDEISRSIHILFENMNYKQQTITHLWEDFCKLLPASK